MIKYTSFLEIEALEVMNYNSSSIVQSSNILITTITSLILIGIVINQLLKLRKTKKDII